MVLLGKLIRAARKERNLGTQEVADRASISRGLLQRIEKGDPKCELGAAFEVAAIVGVRLFDTRSDSLSGELRRADDRLALLPKSSRKKTKVVHDDF
ncbi:MAG: helix-turn-helix transcriptional regulator [Bdellovibrionales bacterium]|nr:helix-turn-helix transcriptional regulator [Bdellovibrionales bacterium]